MPVISADLDPPLGSISRTAPSPTDDDYLMIAVIIPFLLVRTASASPLTGRDVAICAS
jgi:hypothetical protein